MRLTAIETIYIYIIDSSFNNIIWDSIVTSLFKSHIDVFKTTFRSYGKYVKVLLANLFSIVETVSMGGIKIDIPIFLQRIMLCK